VNIPLLRRLRDAQGAFVPLAELGTNREGLRRDLDELVAFGFAIEWHPYLGVAYQGPAERLCPDQIEDDLGTRRVGRRIAVWNRVTSTNDLAARAALSTANDGLIVLAEEQSAGRGSRGRVWSAPARSSILMSVLLFPPPHLTDSAWLTALGAVTAAEVVAEWTGCAAKIKWPNDVRVEGRKVAGILVERGRGPGLGAVIGIGLNANIAPGEFRGELQTTATSLQVLLRRRVDRSELARALIRRLDDHYEQGHVRGAESLNTPWSQRSEHRHRTVRVSTRQGPSHGRLEDLDLQRGLTLQRRDGQRCLITIPDILALDPLDTGEPLDRPPPDQAGVS
jgi:BirA family biotin operon repressor/biotin-[acetyl-CoA-carboxylase] ligase